MNNKLHDKHGKFYQHDSMIFNGAIRVQGMEMCTLNKQKMSLHVGCAGIVQVKFSGLMSHRPTWYMEGLHQQNIDRLIGLD